MSESSLSLFELNKKIKDTIHSSFAETYWVVAEISEVREVRNGHCYMELIEKDEKTEQIIAKSRANIWAYTYRMLKPYFVSATGQHLVSGLKVMVRVSIDFQEVYGFSLNVRDIDPTYTLGDMAQKKQAILNKLSEEGVVDMNKELAVPPVPQRIAVISSPTAAGYEDFCNQLINNSQGYKFYIKLFAATMQGERTEQSVTAALDRIYQHENFFDVVVIIRGGGSTSDLMCFDNYWIAYNIAQFPLPVFSGIGHERDETVVDRVAHTRLKTPTAVAQHIIALVADFDNRLNYYSEALLDITREKLADKKLIFERAHNRLKPLVQHALLIQKNQLNQLMRQLGNSSDRFLRERKNKLNLSTQSLQSVSNRAIRQQQYQLDQISTRLSVRLKHFFNQQQARLELMQKTNELVNPINILKKGYSITTLKGKVLKDAGQLKPGDVITTKLCNGKVDSRVE
ncbi:Exodeoxyribonuclease VII large subunit [Saccharicrinis carchari]|uniref:Exodeoxyribonuclease 7 large subunit n=1 Tax=Saccharicrinis carchari TaxID=1168039 RepID=A0A521DEC7_SACCC|nr:exodeoxyribonuclease VII large subunit [Saccharicrinis carchari]SMO69491.1 Exodeoxyribonuclease VII large subunit [Saccharicrinis carchari]